MVLKTFSLVASRVTANIVFLASEIIQLGNSVGSLSDFGDFLMVWLKGRVL